MYKKHLIQIANTILINSQIVENCGFLKGKLGIIIFLYEYARFTSNTLYSDYADNMLEYVYDRVDKSKPNNLETGLTGTGYVIDYLIKNEFVEGDHETLEEIDQAVELITREDLILEMQQSIPFFSKGLYLLRRDKKSKIEKLMIEFNFLLNSNLTEIPLSYLNSSLFVTNSLLKTDLSMKLYLSILDKLFYYIQAEVNKVERLDSIQLYVLKRNVESIANVNEQVKWCQLICNSKSDPKLINLGWINFIYQYNCVNEIEINEIKLQNVIDDIVFDLNADQLSIYDGLAGLGLELIRRSSIKR